MNRENDTICLLFPMGMELAPFLHRVETRERWKAGRATYRRAWFEGAPLLVIRSGIGPARASRAIRNLPVRPSAILSVGIAGSLTTDLRVGDLIIASETVSDSKPEEPCPSASRLVQVAADTCRHLLGSCRVGRMVSVERAVFTRSGREKLHAKSAALAVDMESHAVALESTRLGVPFAAIRVISDDIHTSVLPKPITIREIGRNPLELGRMLPAAWRWALFLRDIRRAIHMLPPVLVAMIRRLRIETDRFQG